MIAYLITNRLTGRQYVGITRSKTADRRWLEHISLARNGSQYALHRALRKHGVSQFDIATIASATSSANLCELERILIKQYRTFGDSSGYNMTAGGDGIESYRHTAEAKAAMSASRKGKAYSAPRMARWMSSKPWEKAKNILKAQESRRGSVLSEGHKARIASAIVGRKHTPEAIQRMSAAHKVRHRQPFSEVAKKNMSLAALRRVNKPWDEERKSTFRAKYAANPWGEEALLRAQASRRGRPMSDEHKVKIGQANAGRVHSLESRAKMSAVARARGRHSQ